MAAPGPIDPTKPAKYPIILSDALLGKASKETYTGIRYNHRPTLSSDTAPATARLKKSAKDGSYNLGFDDQGDKYQFNGARTTEDGNYVLIFDPARKAFVLHRVDSMFHMNLTKTPTDGNVESLRKQFPHLEVKNTASSSGKLPKGKDASEKAAPSKATGPAAKGKGKAAAAKGKKNAPAKSKAKDKDIELTLPTVTKAPSPLPPPPAPAKEEEKPKRRNRSPIESEDEDDDDVDIGLTIEYPDGNPGPYRLIPPANNFQPTFLASQRRFSKYVPDEEEDADAEFDDVVGYDDEDMEDEPDTRGNFKLPSPVGRHNGGGREIEPPERFVFETGGDDDEDAEGEELEDVGVDDMEPDLEAEFEKEFENLKDEESDVSEED